MAQYLQVVDEAFEAGMIRVYDEEPLGGPLDAHQDHGERIRADGANDGAGRRELLTELLWRRARLTSSHATHASAPT
jgi:hypothetical protein